MVYLIYAVMPRRRDNAVTAAELLASTLQVTALTFHLHLLASDHDCCG